eukprot:TRINITY_DN13775_c0_g1_i5.p1 TRINITY_DN13775_c0_g1~~TRINITY_DN13775_c0_g1_i5.p1  ORF type:complete len:608 (+),score=67.66 TRINITY_DN13775_c0_g1_i5:112-1935(+)
MSSIKDFLYLIGSNTVTYIVQTLIPFGSALMIGHLGAHYLGAATLAIMVTNLTGYSVGIGLGMALDTLCSQAYGARQYFLVGQHTQRAFVILTLLCFPLAFIWAYTEQFLILIGLDEQAAMSGHFAQVLIAGMWPVFGFDLLRRYLQAQSIIWPTVVASFIGSLFNFFINWILIYRIGWGFTGAAVGTVLSNWVLFISLVIMIYGRLRYRRHLRAKATTNPHPLSVLSASPRGPNASDEFVASESSGAAGSASQDLPSFPNTSRSLFGSQRNAYALVGRDEGGAMEAPVSNATANEAEEGVVASDTRESRVEEHTLTQSTSHSADVLQEFEADETWPSWSWSVLRGWFDFFRLGAPSSLSLLIEWGSYEANAAIAGRLGPVALAVHSIYMQSCNLWYTGALGIGIATSTLVGNALGAGNTRRARRVAWLGCGVAAIYGFSIGLVFTSLLRTLWGHIFTSDPKVLELLESTFPIMWLYAFWDATKCVSMGVLRGCGRPGLTVWGNTLACLVVGLPLSLVLTFRVGGQLYGIWGSMATAWTSATLVYLFLIWRTDWEHEATLASKRIDKAMHYDANSSSQAVQDTGGGVQLSQIIPSAPPEEEDNLELP